MNTLTRLTRQHQVNRTIIRMRQRRTTGLQHFLVTSRLFNSGKLFHAHTTLILGFFRIRNRHISRIINRLPMACPNVTRRMRPNLLHLRITRIVSNVRIHRTHMMRRILLQSTRLKRRHLNSPIRKLRHNTLLTLPYRLAPTRVFDILLRHYRLERNIIARRRLTRHDFNQFIRRFYRRTTRTPTFNKRNFASRLLWNNITKPSSFILTRPGSRFNNRRS